MTNARGPRRTRIKRNGRYINDRFTGKVKIRFTKMSHESGRDVFAVVSPTVAVDRAVKYETTDKDRTECHRDHRGIILGVAATNDCRRIPNSYASRAS